jgi:hypothetical protein
MSKRMRIDNNLDENSDFLDYVDSLNNSTEFDQEESDSCEIDSYIKNGDEKIYEGSDIKLSNFIVLFLHLVLKLHLSIKGISLVLQFIKTFMPKSNLIPTSYYMLIKCLNISSLNLVRRQYVCLVCNRHKKYKNEPCHDQVCLNYMNPKVNLNKTTPYYINHDYKERFRLIIAKNWSSIQDYREELKNEPLISDICNARAYKSSEHGSNEVSLILFVDQANFSKSTKDNNLNFILGQITWTCLCD